MYNCFYNYLKENNILYEKQFGFQSGYSTNDAIVQLVDKTFDSFEKEHFTRGVFIDLSKAFDTVDHSILLTKILHGLKVTYLTESRVKIAKQILNMLLVASPKDLFWEHFCF